MGKKMDKLNLRLKVTLQIKTPHVVSVVFAWKLHAMKSH